MATKRYLLLGVPGLLFWAGALYVVVGDIGFRARPFALPGVALFVAAVACGAIAMLRKAPTKMRLPVVLVDWSTIAPWVPFLMYIVRLS